MISRRLTGGGVSTWPFPIAFGLLHNPGSDLLPPGGFFGVAFTNLFSIRMREHVAGFTL